MTKKYLVVDVVGLPGWRTKLFKYFWYTLLEHNGTFREFVVTRQVM